MQQNKTAIVWFTNNLRVQDNEALYQACANYKQVIAVYCFDEELFTKTQFGFKKIEKYRAQFLRESVIDLQKNLQYLNVPFSIYYGCPQQVVTSVCLENKADALFFQKEFTSEENKQIDAVLKNLPKHVTTHSFYDQFLFHPDDVPFSIRKLPEVFTIFRKKVEKLSEVRSRFSLLPKKETKVSVSESKVPSLKALGFDSFELPVNTAFPFKGGETAALQRLNDYFFNTKKLAFYKKTRNGLIGTDYSSKFSSWLANGSISAKTIYWKVREFENEFGGNQSTYWMIFELIWRDYFKFIALKHQNKLFKISGLKNIHYDWKESQAQIDRWINGETQEPFVNANMIELKLTGWMSNRGRQNVASYFAKELLLDWRIGAAYFESMLIDYDVHSNYGNWQYVAGVGNDPRDRKFNVQLQAERYDGKGAFQRMWLQPTLF
ncbi:DASH family cryptochrome [Seonamhaeicola algicola]|uniref:Cryptochrome DASH n=1 Tax=Seonamhaeicola algicola TaxID=1719036 RepID=A0A5C7B1Q5_9FLAO|nr:DASH family cryptochrome [Seonamhaeicola algicola]TXE15066.1 DASH family cryptochrome [Seonamhaeicola algicola]